jgi:hypothetical protein
MELMYYDTEPELTVKKAPPLSVFLAGPTDRTVLRTAWRVEALDHLEKYEFHGTVYIPEWSIEPRKTLDYGYIVDWETHFLNKCTNIIFWIPRTEDLPGFTTNVEFGIHYMKSKIWVGSPPDAQRIRYLKYIYLRDTKKKWWFHLDAMIKTFCKARKFV